MKNLFKMGHLLLLFSICGFFFFSLSLGSFRFWWRCFATFTDAIWFSVSAFATHSDILAKKFWIRALYLPLIGSLFYLFLYFHIFLIMDTQIWIMLKICSRRIAKKSKIVRSHRIYLLLSLVMHRCTHENSKWTEHSGVSVPNNNFRVFDDSCIL